MGDRTFKLTLKMSDNSTIDAGTFTCPQGDPGKSAYALAREHGYTGTEAELGAALAAMNSGG